MSIKHFIGKDGAVYSIEQYRSNGIPVAALPLMAEYHPLPPREPFDLTKFTVIPCQLFEDTGPFAGDFKSKLIVLDKSDVDLSKFTPPPEPPRRVIPGFTLVAEGVPYNFDGMCPHCNSKLLHVGTEGEGGWVHNYTCLYCASIVIMNEGDKMGGQFDGWELFVKDQQP